MCLLLATSASLPEPPGLPLEPLLCVQHYSIIYCSKLLTDSMCPTRAGAGCGNDEVSWRQRWVCRPSPCAWLVGRGVRCPTCTGSSGACCIGKHACTVSSLRLGAGSGIRPQSACRHQPSTAPFACTMLPTQTVPLTLRRGGKKAAQPAADKPYMAEEPVKPAGNPPATYQTV